LYIGCIKEISRKNYATYEIKEYDFAVFEFFMQDVYCKTYRQSFKVFLPGLAARKTFVYPVGFSVFGVVDSLAALGLVSVKGKYCR